MPRLPLPHPGPALRPLAIVGLLVFIALVVVGQAFGGPPGRSTPAPLPPDEMELRVFDVGQGDAILLRFGQRALLVDAGPDPETAREVLLPRLARLGVEGLDGLVLTHADADHIGGAADILEVLPVATVWMASSRQDHPLLSVIEAAARQGGTRVEAPANGQALEWHPAVSVQVNIATPSVASGDNNQSMVLHVRYRESRLSADRRHRARGRASACRDGWQSRSRCAEGCAPWGVYVEFAGVSGVGAAAGGGDLGRDGECIQSSAGRCAATVAGWGRACVSNGLGGRRCGAD